MAEAKRRLAAILAADVANYSRLMGADEEGTVAALDACRAIFKQAIESHDGVVVDTAGDSVLATFDSVVQAVRCSVEIQKAVAARDADLAEEKRMRFRIGINLGDVITKSDGTIYGDGVNVAARLESLAEPGGITVSGPVFDHAENKLPAEFEFTGERTVKNIAKPVRAYRVISEIRPAASPSAHMSLTLPDKPSIAVLAFDNLSGDPAQEYFADGIAEDIITGLSLDRGLFVIARNSSFTYKGKAVNVSEIGRDLGVRYVVEGSVRKASNRVRINAQLIEAASGSHIWAERYDRDLEDIFAVQDDITQNVVANVAPELMTAEAARARRKPPNNLDAWDYALRALWHSWQFTRRDDDEARRLAEHAVAMDPASVLGYTVLANVNNRGAQYSWDATFAESLKSSEQAALAALEIDDKYALAHAALGQANLLSKRHDAALRRFNRALELDPNNVWAHGFKSMALTSIGEYDRGLDSIRTALRLSPRDPYRVFWYSIAGYAAFGAADYDAAIDWCERGCDVKADYPGLLRVMAASFGQANRIDEAKKAVAALLVAAPGITIQSTRLQIPWKLTRDMNRYLDGLRDAGLPES